MGDVPIHHWERCQSYVDRFVTEASRLVTRCRIDEIEQGIGFIGKVMEQLLKHISRRGKSYHLSKIVLPRGAAFLITTSETLLAILQLGCKPFEVLVVI